MVMSDKTQALEAFIHKHKQLYNRIAWQRRLGLAHQDDELLLAENAINEDEIRAALSGDTGEAHEGEDADIFRMPLEFIAEVAVYFKADCEKIRAWWRTPNPMLGDITPLKSNPMTLVKFMTESKLLSVPSAAMDVEALKREVRDAHYDMDYAYDQGWNQCLDHIAKRGLGVPGGKE
jgi:hypothetical protein